MVVYERDGVRMVGHIGTTEPNSLETSTVKECWRNFANANPDMVFGGFNPARVWSTDELLQSQRNESDLKILGLCTVERRYFSFVLWGGAIARRIQNRRP
jgi:hypothetical protein